MAKRTPAPPPVAVMDDNAQSFVMLAEVLLSDFFIDPDNEEIYKQLLSVKRSGSTEGRVLHEETVELEGVDCQLRIEALRALAHFRVIVEHPSFNATIEGNWSFDNEELKRPSVSRSGDEVAMPGAIEDLVGVLEGSGLDDDEEFADFLAAVENDEEEAPLIGDDPTEPPAPTALEKGRLKAIARRVARDPDARVKIDDRGWLEQMPQLLPVITEALIEAAAAKTRDDELVLAYHVLLAAQLEFVRYRQDRGWEWAQAMLDAFQQRLIAVAATEAIPRDDWFTMCTALSEARVPVGSETQNALAEAGFKPEEVNEPPEEMLRMLRGFMDELARMIASPFDVIASFKDSGAMLPASLRCFMAMEFALSPHQVLRDAVPLLLLDEEAAVRSAAATALEQTARPETLSPDALRRAITIRNWIPAPDRPELDSAIRKARLAGVEIGTSPQPARDLEFYATALDGSGAQSILAASRTAKKGVFAGLLLRHGTGVVDVWVDQDISKGKIGKLLREAQMEAPVTRVDKSFVDMMAQHAIGTSVDQGTVPPVSLLEVSEILGGGEWRDRRLDVRAETDRLMAELDPADRSPQGIRAAFVRGLAWMSAEDILVSWFEDGPAVQKALAKLPRTDKAGMASLVMTDILPGKRVEWAERFLLLALWYEASMDAKQRARARDVVPVAHALVDDEPVNAIPIMSVIAAQTVRAMLEGGW